MRQSDARNFLADLHEELPLWVEQDLRRRDIPWGRLSEAEMKEVALQTIDASPRRWGECYLTNRDEYGGGPWRFFDYQRDAISYPYNLLGECGKGTGKSRDIVCLMLYTQVVKGGGFLFVAHSTTARKTIQDELAFQRDKSRFLTSLYPRGAISYGNVPSMRGPRGSMGYLLLTSRDGRQLHSVHVGRGYLFADEADLWPEAAWAPFHSRAESGTYIRAWSVPNGPPGSRFSRMVEAATPLESMRLAGVSDATRRTHFALVKWSREQMPAPHWSAEKEAQARVLYPDELEYQRYIYGRRTDPSGAVFPWGILQHAFVAVPGYRALRMVYDLEADRVAASVSAGIDLHAAGADPLRRVDERSFEADAFDPVAYAAEHLEAIGCDVVGVDCGRNQDPTEITLWQRTASGGMRLRARVHMLYAPTSAQGRLVSALAKGECCQRPVYGVGIEATAASHGQAVYDYAVDVRAGGVARDLVSAYDWSRREPVLDQAGVPLRGDDRHELRRTIQESATVLIEGLLERQKSSGCSLELFADPDVRQSFQGATAVRGAGGRKFNPSKKEPDHILESARAAVLRMRDARAGSGAVFRVASAGSRRSVEGFRRRRRP